MSSMSLNILSKKNLIDPKLLNDSVLIFSLPVFYLQRLEMESLIIFKMLYFFALRASYLIIIPQRLLHLWSIFFFWHSRLLAFLFVKSTGCQVKMFSLWLASGVLTSGWICQNSLLKTLIWHMLTKQSHKHLLSSSAGQVFWWPAKHC